VVLLIIAVGCCVVRFLVYRDPHTGLTFQWPDPSVLRFRVVPLVVGVTVGIALAVSGVLLQALLRNPLASPYILGVSTGAALGVILAMYLGVVLGIELLRDRHALPALVGAVGVLAIVYGLGQRRGWLDPVSLILIGVIVSAICGAAIMLLQHLVTNGLRGDLLVWMMGRIPQAAPTEALAAAGAITIAGAVLSAGLGRTMDAATLSDDEARSVGLALGPLRVWLFLVAGALAAMSVSIAGPIGFVGLVAPHAARLILGPRHTVLVIGAALCGVILIVGADAARQTFLLGAGRVPIGVFTALVGGPAFIWLLRSGRGQA
jgi:iron complex transport system permease protein